MAYVISDLELRRTPFFASNTWSYVNWPGYLNIGQRLPPDLCAQLSSDDAYESAASLPSVTWSDALRNALAHGCIAYLNESGFDTMGEQASMLCFLSEKRTRGELPSTHCLRISEEDFKHFLHSWVEWLNGSGLMRLMAAE
ncbi:hypothetical protein IYX23_14435 [Methylocystis sp. L43]|uniref:hypothetical protein n=1 Tax=unclassified Methylocystis TaxID=2625913 RepID=UPI0018C2D119|nr:MULTISPECIES: hypothetical protein [unclassified Methylocystis]MBG0798864.1 hypothetical protein [Methylocystis sp. L43]MBG0806371.1 hypothetical protein [Methylocystis sp. H15]